MLRALSLTLVRSCRAALVVLGVALAGGCGRLDDERPVGGTLALDGPSAGNDRQTVGEFCLNPGQPGGGVGGARGGGATRCLDDACLTCPGDGQCYACEGQASIDRCMTDSCEQCARVGDDSRRCLKCVGPDCFVCTLESAAACAPPTCPACTRLP